MNELDRLLECVTSEPAYGPAFYQALLAESVYALIPQGVILTAAGTVRFIMWTGDDGQRVIPCFSNRASIRRVLTKDTQSVRLQGRIFLEACRGAFVVLNPNEKYFCRLTPSEVALLLDTGAPNASESYVLSDPIQIDPRAPDVRAELLLSLSLLFSQFPDIERAYMATIPLTTEDAPPVWLLAVLMNSESEAQRVSQQLSSLLADSPPENSMDLMTMLPGDANEVMLAANAKPFYDRALGARIVMASSSPSVQ